MRLFLFLLFVPTNAYAYLDPGTGSYVIQVVIAMLFGGIFALKIYWQKTKSYFTKIFSKGSKEDKQK